MAGSIPGPADSVPSKFNDLERRVRNLETSPSLRSANVPSGTTTFSGGTLIIDGGDLVLKDVGGTILFRIGTQTFGDRGLTINRADGSPAVKVAKIFGPGDALQRFFIYDLAGNVIGGDAQLSPSGFDSPHMPHEWRPIDRSDAKTTTSATFVSLFEHRGIRGNPGLPITFSVLCSDGTTSGEVQVIDATSGTPLSPFFAAPWVGTIPLATTVETFITSPALIVPGAANDAIRLQVQARRTAGAGTVSIAVAGAVGGGA